MFRLAIRMLRSDLRSLMQGWAMAVVGVLCIFCLVLLPLKADELNVGCFAYAIVFSISWFKPRFTRAFHVVPLTIKQIRMLAIYRILLVIGLYLVGSAIGIAVLEACNEAWNIRFGSWGFFYLELMVLCWEESLKGFRARVRTKKNIIWTIAECIFILTSVLLTFGVLKDVLPFYAEYLIQSVLFLLYISYFIYYAFGKMDFYDYRQTVGLANGREEFMV